MNTQPMRKYLMLRLFKKLIIIIFVGVLTAINCEAIEKETTLFDNRYKTILRLLKNDKKLECSTGSFWVQMSAKAKFSYLNGFLDGIISNKDRCKGIIQQNRSFKEVDYKAYISNEDLRTLVNCIDQKYFNDKDYYMPVHDRLMMIGTIEGMKKELEQWAKAPDLMDKINNDPKLNAEWEKIRKDMELNKNERERRYREIRAERKKYAENFTMETGIEKVDPSDGYYWINLTLEEKYSYIIGIIDSISMSEIICSQHPQAYKDQYLKLYYHIKKIRDMSDAIDNVFSDVAYRKLTINFVLMVENGRSSGMISSEDAKKTYDLTINERRSQ